VERYLKNKLEIKFGRKPPTLNQSRLNLAGRSGPTVIIIIIITIIIIIIIH